MDDAGQFLRNVRRQLLNRPRFGMQDSGGHRHVGLGLEGPRSGQHLVQHHAEGEDIRFRSGRLPFQLLRRHIGNGSNHRAERGLVLERERRFGVAEQPFA